MPLGLAQRSNGTTDDLKRQIRQIQSVGQLFKHALAVIAGIEKAPGLVRKDEGVRRRIRTLSFPGKEISDEHRRQMNRRQALFRLAEWPECQNWCRFLVPLGTVILYFFLRQSAKFIDESSNRWMGVYLGVFMSNTLLSAI